MRRNRFVLVRKDGVATVMDITPDGLLSIVLTITSKTGAIQNAAFSPDDSTIATRSSAGIAFWEAASGVEFHRIPASKGSWLASGDPTLAELWTPFSPDGRWIGMTGTDTRVQAVLPPAVAMEFSSRRLMPAEMDFFDVGLAKLVVQGSE